MTWFSHRRRGAERRNVRLERFQQVLLAAQRTRGYRQLLECAGLAEPAAIDRLRSIEEALRKLPSIDWAEFRGSPADFYNLAAPDPELRRLRYPISTEIRTAVLGGTVAESNSVRMFQPGWIDQLRQFRPEAIAGPAPVLMQLAEAASSGREAIPTLTRAIIVFTGIEHGALSEAGRDLLWKVFEVPVFEQCLGADGSLLAWECEAHEGLHTVEENAVVEQSSRSRVILTSLTDRRHPAIRVATALAADFESETCGCGQTGPRLIGLSAPELRQDASAAVGALKN